MSFLCSNSVEFQMIFSHCRKNPSMPSWGSATAIGVVIHKEIDQASAAYARSQLVEHGDQAVNSDQYLADLHDDSSR